jgi:hypothetical protein
MTPAERSLRARAAAHRMHAMGKTNTQPGRDAFLTRFEREVDPDGELPEDERRRRALHARKAYMVDLASKGVQARKAKAVERRESQQRRLRAVRATPPAEPQTSPPPPGRPEETCAICGRGGRLVSDHDHRCCPAGRCCNLCSRGRLCSQCNTALGMMADSPERLAAAAAYLRHWLPVVDPIVALTEAEKDAESNRRALAEARRIGHPGDRLAA